MHSTHSEQKRSDKLSSGRLQEVQNNGKSLNFQSQKVVVVAYRRWSFTRGSNCKALTGKMLVFWIGGSLREVVAHGGSTVMVNSCSMDKILHSTTVA